MRLKIAHENAKPKTGQWNDLVEPITAKKASRTLYKLPAIFIKNWKFMPFFVRRLPPPS